MAIIRSGYSSRILEMRRVPIPAPVPPPREWVIWNPWSMSQFSASLRTTSRTESTSSAPASPAEHKQIADRKCQTFSSDCEALLLPDELACNRVPTQRTLSVVTLCPVVTSTALAEDKVVGPEEVAHGAGTDRVHCTGLQVDQDRTGNVLAASSLIAVRKRTSRAKIC